MSRYAKVFIVVFFVPSKYFYVVIFRAIIFVNGLDLDDNQTFL